MLEVLLLIGVVALAALVVTFVFLTLRNVIERVKKKIIEKRVKRVIVEHVKKVEEEANRNKKKITNLDDLENLEKLFGKQGLVEAEIKADDTVDVDSVRILQTDKIDDALKRALEQEDGCMIIGK